ncbi:hypothetical protein HELRODRAFT_182513 [Helobdella robusta]|uniref:Uncharacterized protein n=1 Tax=Helobdella robusta TaxID=6412 RepID=T1FIA9_HELRO|nr:hypothetical protein HELRODRAFT_182513 [Helobdella robusta]ESN90922.1 hypothetical protein HELRODRAFT_182513 [Helobdella robusta]
MAIGQFHQCTFILLTQHLCMCISRLRNDSRLLEKISQQRGTSTLNKTLNRQLSTQTASRSRRSQPAASQRKLKQLKESEDALRDKERQLEQFEKKLLATDMENKKILENIENICTALENSNDSAAAADKHHRDLAMEPDVNQLGRYQLLLQALALKIDDFTTLLKNIKEDMLFNSSPALTEVQMDHLVTQKKLLERDLRRFDEVFSFLRREMIRLLEERPNFIQLNVERDDLLNKVHKLSKAHEVADLKKMSLEKNDVLSELEALKSEHLQNVNSMESLKQTKAHLQRELTNKESELSRLTSKVKNLETSLHVEKSLKEELKEKVNVDKENFKKAARLHKMRADKNESNLANAQTALVEKNSEVEKLVEQMNSMKLQMAKMAKEKMMAVAELDNVKSVQQKRKSSAGGDADADDNDDNSSKKLKEIKGTKICGSVAKIRLASFF